MLFIGNAMRDEKAVYIYRQANGLFTADEYENGKKLRRRTDLTLNKIVQRYARFDLAGIDFSKPSEANGQV